MASNSRNWILSVKALLISTGVVSIAMAMKFSVPLILDFVPLIWSSLLSWLKPPYLYVVINGIVIAIAASSRFHHKLDNDNRNHHSEPSVVQSTLPPTPSDLPSDSEPVISSPPEFGVVDSLPVLYENEIVSETQILDVKPVVVNGSQVIVNEEENNFVISRSNWMSPQKINSPESPMEHSFPVREKPLVSSRFGHRKPLRSSPEGGKALRVAKPKRQDTLESTWKTITDGRHMPLTRHLKKLDTWENHDRSFNVNHHHLSPPQNVVKSETFKDRTNYEDSPVSSASPRSPAKLLRKEPSLSQDELNRRVEAFIKKFNEEMRLQRQESLNQYMEMIDRGAH